MFCLCMHHKAVIPVKAEALHNSEAGQSISGLATEQHGLTSFAVVERFRLRGNDGHVGYEMPSRHSKVCDQKSPCNACKAASAANPAVSVRKIRGPNRKP
jgi:hypothetical protein